MTPPLLVPVRRVARHPLAAALLLGASLSLAGCNNSGALSESFNRSFRENYVKTCVEEATRQSAAKNIQHDWQKSCACMADYMIGISSNPINLVSNSNDRKQIDAAVAKCI